MYLWIKFVCLSVSGAAFIPFSQKTIFTFFVCFVLRADVCYSQGDYWLYPYPQTPIGCAGPWFLRGAQFFIFLNCLNLSICYIWNSQPSPSSLFVSPDWFQSIYHFCMMTTDTVQKSSHTSPSWTLSPLHNWSLSPLVLACIIFIPNFPFQVNWINIKDNFCFNISPKSVWNRTNLNIRIPDVSCHYLNWILLHSALYLMDFGLILPI